MPSNTKAGGIFKEGTDGSTMIAFNTADKIIELNAIVTNIDNAGTPNTSVTVTEYGDGIRHFTKLSFTNLAIGSATGAAALGFGRLIYTFPAGVQKVKAVYQEVALTGAAAIIADTPEIGLGTVIASGAISVLGGTATFEDLLEGTAVTNCNAAVNIDSDPVTNQLIATAGPKTVYLNVADTWAAAGALTGTGFVLIEWDTLV